MNQERKAVLNIHVAQKVVLNPLKMTPQHASITSVNFLKIVITPLGNLESIVPSTDANILMFVQSSEPCLLNIALLTLAPFLMAVKTFVLKDLPCARITCVSFPVDVSTHLAEERLTVHNTLVASCLDVITHYMRDLSSSFALTTLAKRQDVVTKTKMIPHFAKSTVALTQQDVTNQRRLKDSAVPVTSANARKLTA